jgi:hypothetical protein
MLYIIVFSVILGALAGNLGFGHHLPLRETSDFIISTLKFGVRYYFNIFSYIGFAGNSYFIYTYYCGSSEQKYSYYYFIIIINLI